MLSDRSRDEKNTLIIHSPNSNLDRIVELEHSEALHVIQSGILLYKNEGNKNMCKKEKSITHSGTLTTNSELPGFLAITLFSNYQLQNTYRSK